MSLGLRFVWLAFALLGVTAHAQMACPPGMAPVWSGAWSCAPTQPGPAYGHPGPSREQAAAFLELRGHGAAVGGGQRVQGSHHDDQDDGKPQQVKALNFAVSGNSGLGALSFEVPTMTLLLDMMEDRQSFEIRIGASQSLSSSGRTARKRATNCVTAWSLRGDPAAAARPLKTPRISHTSAFSKRADSLPLDP